MQVLDSSATRMHLEDVSTEDGGGSLSQTMANLKIVAVTFEIDVQKKAAQFSVPEEVCRLLGIERGDVALTVEDASGRRLIEGTKTLKSGKEIYGRDIRDCGVTPGQRIRVEASVPRGVNARRRE